ncbi:pheromone processing endoprotease Kex2 [Myxozyma melibiosi]|uniref:Pheromone processing endoprotease Kex2 n=1 Tax=Myxozyma melibiosi TaxID=54550 RepID=A0ABR1F360_9ASCO
MFGLKLQLTPLLAVLVLACSLAPAFADTLNPRAHVAPRDYAKRDYFAFELVWPDLEPADPHSSAATDTSRTSIPDAGVLSLLSDFASEYGLTFEEQLGSLDNHYLFSAPKANKAEYLISRKIKKRYGGIHAQAVKYFEKMRVKKLHKRASVAAPKKPPIDSGLVPVREVEELLDIRDPEFEKQWHLINPYQPGHDINITGVWMQNVTGEGIVTAIVDDGLDFESDDLRDNFYPQGSYDFNDNKPLPKPMLADDRHGTRCAGEIAAAKNDVCGVGSAYDSKVAGIRILSKEISDADEALALNFAMQDIDIYSCSWGPPDDGKAMDAPGVLIKRAMVNGVEKGRGGKGSVFVFASGNGAQNGDNCNFDGYTNSIYSITVGAIDRKGLHPYYAEDCSAQLVVTYSSGSGDYIHTTDVGKAACTDVHGGTSAAAPLAAGIFALVLSVRPDLTWRDMQYLTIMTAVPVMNADALYQTTAIGRQFSHRYGYGKLDTYAIVEAAKAWKNVKPQAWLDTHVAPVHKDIPQNDEGFTSYITIDASMLQKANLAFLEHVQVKVNIKHQRRGELSVRLESPTGIVSLLATPRPFDQSTEGMVEWWFMTVAHWGETGIGTWKLTVYDTHDDQFTGTFEDWTMRIWGQGIDADAAKPFPLPKLPPGLEDPTFSGTVALPPSTTSTTQAQTSSPSTTSPTSDPTSVTSPAPSTTSEPDSSWDDYDDNDSDDKPDDSSDSGKSEKLFGFIPTFGMSMDKVVWIYGSALLIVGFLTLIGVWLCVARRNRQGLRRSRAARDENGYEFQVLRNAADMEDGAGHPPRRKARDLYDAFENIDEDDAFAVEDLLSEDEDDGAEDELLGGRTGGRKTEAREAKEGDEGEAGEDKVRLLSHAGEASGSQ